MANPEARLQTVVVKYLKAVLPPLAVFWSVPNGGKMSEKRRKFAAAMGEYAGASDLMVLCDGKLVCIEIKRGADKLFGKERTYQSKSQKQFQNEIVAAGGFYGVCRSTEDVGRFLTECGVPIRERIK